MSALSIVLLLGIQSITPDVETENAALYIHVPWVAPAAYLHTIYRPAGGIQRWEFKGGEFKGSR